MPLFRGLWGAAYLGGSWVNHAQAGKAVCWFLNTLIWFNVAYAVLPYPPAALPFPAVWKLVVVGALLGALQGYVANFGFELAGIPSEMLGGLPFDVAFFAVGCAAKRSGWLDSVRELSTGGYWSARVIALLSIAFLAYAITDGGHEIRCALAGARRLSSGGFASLPGTLKYSSPFGLLTSSLSISILHFFPVHVNFQNRLTMFAGKAHYGVYVFQVIIIPCVVSTFIEILRASGHQLDFSSCGGGPISSTVVSTGIVVGGWLYTLAAVTLVIWPFAYHFRRLPGVSSVL